MIYTREFKNIPDIVKGIMTNKERNRIMDKINKLTHDDLFMTELEAIEWAEWERKSRETEARKKGLKDGIEQGFQNGIAQNTTDMILSMLENNADLEFISKVTNKSIDEINEIIKEKQ